ncbi:MAG TPA: outer membrane beta-barrel protein [Thermoanaerobaculia bacterium]|nr:outer membrane beta-barrel protein [Thermoanaerobaculia bacterium]
MLKKCAVMAALVLALSPASARADWLFTPNIGAGFGGNARGGEHLTYGASIGFMGAGVFGWEADLSYTPEFFEGDDNDPDLLNTGDSNVTTVMGNVLIGVPIGGQTGGGVRPYFAGGAGLLQTRVEDADAVFEIDNNDFGINLGGGVMGFMTDNVGFRGDIRYFRAFGEDDGNDQVDFDLSDFDFWRGTVGVTFRW